MIQIRDVPDDLHRKLRIRAAEQGMSLSAYLRRELQALADRRTVAEVLDEWQGSRAPLSAEQILDAVHGDRR